MTHDTGRPAGIGAAGYPIVSPRPERNPMTTDQTRRAVLTVTVTTRPDGGHYFDQADFTGHVTEWVRAALKGQHAVDDVTIAVSPVPPPADRAAETPAAECSAQNRNYESGPRLCVRAAQHHGDHIDERGFHWSDTVAVYPVSDGTFRRGTDVRALLRRVAAEEQPAADPRP